MAGKKKNNVEYFPHYIGRGKTMNYIKQKYGNDGYATYFILLEELANADFHFLDLKNEDGENYSLGLMYISNLCLIDENRLVQIIDDLVKFNVFDKDLWKKRVLWSKKFYDSVEEAWKRREEKPYDKEMLLSIYSDFNEPEQQILFEKEEIIPIEAKQPQKAITKREPKKIEERNIEYPWITETFVSKWNIWKEYKLKEFSFKYKSVHSEQMALIDLAKKSDGIEEYACMMIDKAISNGWKGFFKLNNNDLANGKQQSDTENGKARTVSNDYLERVFNELQS
jgi:hypothetical protein